MVLTSCNEDLELIGEFKETAVVYAILDKSENVHMIKITRAFIGPGNSYSIAQIADSSYFNEVDARITEFVNGVETRFWDLTDTTVTNKETNGVFYAPEQKLYYFKNDPSQPLKSASQGASYRLDITINGGEFTVTGTTELVDDMALSIGPGSQASAGFNFATDIGVYTNTSVKVTTNAEVVNLKLQVDYSEFRVGDTSNVSFSYTVGEQDVTSGTTSFSTKGANFYQQLGKSIEENADPFVYKRNLESITIIAVGAGEELNNYMLANQPGNNLSQNKPVYTNLTATNDANVIGVFSSRNTETKTILYVNDFPTFSCLKNQPSRQEMCNGFYTASGLFCSQFNYDSSQSWFCN